MRPRHIAANFGNCRNYCSKDDEPNAVKFRLTPATVAAPGPAAAAAAPADAAAAAPAASPAASTAAASAAAASAAPPSDFLAELRLWRIFLVEHIELGQADVRDFLLAKKNFMRL